VLPFVSTLQRQSQQYTARSAPHIPAYFLTVLATTDTCISIALIAAPRSRRFQPESEPLSHAGMSLRLYTSFESPTVQHGGQNTTSNKSMPVFKPRLKPPVPKHWRGSNRLSSRRPGRKSTGATTEPALELSAADLQYLNLRTTHHGLKPATILITICTKILNAGAPISRSYQMDHAQAIRVVPQAARATNPGSEDRNQPR
jgi:hypothetical protein